MSFERDFISFKQECVCIIFSRVSPLTCVDANIFQLSFHFIRMRVCLFDFPSESSTYNTWKMRSLLNEILFHLNEIMFVCFSRASLLTRERRLFI
jgi:hypothetical protein